MDFKELCKQRYSVRNYLSQKVEKEKIDYLLQCAQLAPSAANLQPWKLFVITEEEMQKRIQESYNREWFRSAPMCIVICNDRSRSWKRNNTDGKDHGDIDVAIVTEHISLAATSIGLGTCWICNFDPRILGAALQLPSNLEPIVILSLGYIDQEQDNSGANNNVEKKRRPISDFTQWI